MLAHAPIFGWIRPRWRTPAIGIVLSLIVSLLAVAPSDAQAATGPTLGKVPTTLAQTAGKTLTVTTTVTTTAPGEVILTLKKTGKKVAAKALAKAGSSKVTLTFPKTWWKEGSSSTWVLTLQQDMPVEDDAPSPSPSASASPSASEKQETTRTTVEQKTVSVIAKRAFQNAKKYVQLTDRNINFKDNTVRKLGTKSGQSQWGVRVMKLMKRLKLKPYRKGYYKYSAKVKSKVKSFQKKYNKKHATSKRLRTDGITDYKTWRALGLSKSSWYLDNAAAKNRTNLASSKKDHIEAMIAQAYKYRGKPYLNGASSTPSYGLDCSGLVMQAMYAAGVTGLKNTPMWHTRDEWGSRYLWKTSKLKKVKYKNRKRGDLIFYSNGYGTVIHVAIYLGDNKVIESWPNKVQVANIKNSHRSRIKGVKRVFG